jgi:dihydrofolate synthase/folylpolyglutamate synthase
MLFYTKQKKQEEIESSLKMPDLETFLATKPLFYAEIDYTRMPRAWKSVAKHFKLPKIIHVVGTNGKGSTGRFLAHYLYQSGFSVGHYSSPHILRFNERIWIDGEDVEDSELSLYHDKLYHLLSEEFRASLSFFEYTTLLAIALFESCDYIVLEAGLGGEYDATAVFSNILTLVTPIDIDHCDFLGDSIEEIAMTKLNAIQSSAIIATQKHMEVYQVSQKLMINRTVNIFRTQQFFTLEELDMIALFLRQYHFPSFLKVNLALALAAIKFLGFEMEMENLHGIELFGRCQKIAPNVTIDVGHNALAANAMLDVFKEKKIHLVFNSFADKDYEETLKILQPAIKIIEILPILNERIEKKEYLIKVIEKLGIPYKDFEELDSAHEYLVFGSFSVVEAFLKQYGKTQKSKISDKST